MTPIEPSSDDPKGLARDLIPAVPSTGEPYQVIGQTCAACGNGPYARDCQFCGGSGFAPPDLELPWEALRKIAAEEWPMPGGSSPSAWARGIARAALAARRGER